jgi:hypothetical protein
MRAREGTALFKARLAALETLCGDLGKRQQAMADGLGKSLADQEARWTTRLAVLEKANQALKLRLAELERPRGLRAIFNRFSRRRQLTAEDESLTDRPKTEQSE